MKCHAEATQRNREPLLVVLREVLPSGKILELASGTGEHAVFFSRALPACTWQPTDPDDVALASIAAHRAEAGTANLLAPVRLDVHAAAWGAAAENIAAVVCINMIHIAPWSATEALFARARDHLPGGAPLVLYGPYRFHGAFAAASNAYFDARLRAEEPLWGVRDIDDIDELAATLGMRRERLIALPANNHVLVFRCEDSSDCQ